MSNPKYKTDTDAILMTMNQISQTIDVMVCAVGRFRRYLRNSLTLVKTALAVFDFLSQKPSVMTALMTKAFLWVKRVLQKAHLSLSRPMAIFLALSGISTGAFQ
jgi:hypothetical protein